MDFLTLSQLNTRIGREIKDAFPATYWVMAETSDVRVNNGHCYLELIEKSPINNSLIAKARGYIWANTFELIKPYFEQITGRDFTSGLKILVNVSVDFHSVYGYGLNICDIEPSYTLGDLQARRQAILRQLEEEGILTLNKELEMPYFPQRIAVISSATAAGYEDFCRHLTDNRQGFVFYSRLFPAVMQGEQTASSIISALDKLFEYKDLFDVAVIIRGGGATSDLSAFDSYELAANCAQFPLPIITGIGHERDDTVLDFIAFHRAKTPTAVADFLIEQMEETASVLFDCQESIRKNTLVILESFNEKLKMLTAHLPFFARNLLEKEQSSMEMLRLKIRNDAVQMILNQEAQLKEKESFFRFSSPDYILAKGYSITLKNGKAVKSAKELFHGDVVETVLAEGRVKSVVTNTLPVSL
ncbi:MAG: exodeoxyribonuclease VII large subunit [Candidatus Azobacteroides sp.]|nr:exodeoxyribonuclease VII large subunit [Candidatus Azobacteroides sp.]